MAQTKKTDNAFLRDKVELRIKHSPKEIVVLDCFSGKGVIWKSVKYLTGRSVKSLPIDHRPDNIGFHLHGDNVSFLESLDLSRFNVIDLDAYGIPYEQLKILFKRHYQGRVFVTFIQTIFGGMPHEMLIDLGFTKEMIEKTPSLFARRGWEYFKQWLTQKGVREIVSRSHARKHYLTFCLSDAAAPALGSDTLRGGSLADPA